MDQVISAIDDVDYKSLHLLVIESRDLRPRDRAIRTVHHNIREVTGHRGRRDTRVEVLQKRVPEAFEDNQFREALLQQRFRDKQPRCV